MQNGMFKLANMTTTFGVLDSLRRGLDLIPSEISIAIREAFFNFLIMPADGTTDG
jgi:hypothetical protein